MKSMSLNKSDSIKGLNFHRILIYSIFRKFPTICPLPSHPPVLPSILYSLRKRQMPLVIIHLIEQVFPYIYAFRRYVRLITLIAMCFFFYASQFRWGSPYIYILSYCSIRVRRSMSIYIYLWYWETKPRSIDLVEIFCLEIWCYR